MHKHVFFASLLALSLGGCCMGGHHHEGSMKGEKEENEGTEVKITVDQMPAPVQSTLQKEGQGAPITDAEKETEDGKTTYEAHATIGGSPYVIKVADDGTLLVKKLKQAKKHDDDKDDKDEK